MKWIRCPGCGREWPETYYAIDNKTGKRHEICNSCRNSRRAMRDYELYGKKAREARKRK